ncbi:unnamed protein product [Camellia sinensis]
MLNEHCTKMVVPPSILAFFVLSHLLFLHSFGEDNNSFQHCPESFHCGNLGEISFPYSNTSYPHCGLCTVDCKGKVQKLGVTDQIWYELHGKLSNDDDHILNVTDKNLERLIKSKSCDLFTFYLSWTLPTTPSFSFTVSPNLTFFKCPTSSSSLDQRIEKFFSHNHNYRYYKGCSGYTVYYKYPDVPHRSLLINERILQSCVLIQLPVFSLNDRRKRNVRDLFSILDSKFSLGFNVSKECGECHLKGGHCPRYNSSKFQCIEQAKHGTNHLILILAIGAEGGSVYFGVSVFSYVELEEATHNFDPTKELGDGGFGTVYHGKLQDGQEVAVKCLYEHNYKRVR